MQAYDVLEHYCGTTDVHYGHIPNMTTMFTDSFFLYGVTKYIDDYHLKYSSKPVYHYINSYHNENYQVLKFIRKPSNLITKYIFRPICSFHQPCLPSCQE